MNSTLLPTKFTIPPLLDQLVERNRLTELLNEGVRGKLCIVSAPAGFGKTTLLCDWLRKFKTPVAWLSLDEQDNDLIRFFVYFITAMQRIDGSIGRDILSALRAVHPPSIEQLLIKLISEINNLENDFILILDDFHIVTDQSIFDALRFLLEHLPHKMHIIISGRVDPPLPLARFRVKGQMTEIRSGNLRFSRDEAEFYLNDLMDLGLSSEQIDALEVRTEGWIASIMLAAQSLRGRSDKHDFVEDFSGSNRYIMDYLIDEVMSQQSKEVQAFLYQTSILGSFCANLCDDVLEISNSRQIIKQLEQSNLFLISLDENRSWFRYHNLFTDFLEHRQNEKNPEILSVLHRRASQWYETNGQVDEAVGHALLSGDLERVATLVEETAASLTIRKELNKLLRWIDFIPENLRRNHPLLCVYHAWALLFTAQLEAVEPTLMIAEASQHLVQQTPISAFVTTIRAFQATHSWDSEKAILLSKRALKQMSSVPSDQSTLIHQGAATINLADNYRISGDLTKARQLYTEAIALNQKADNIFAMLGAFWSLGDVAKTQGQLRRAVDIYKRGLQAAATWLDQNEHEGVPLLATEDLHLRLGAVLYQLNDLTGVAKHVQRANELFELEETWERLLGYKMMAYLHQATGEYNAALDMLNKSNEIFEGLNFQKLYPFQDPLLIDLYIILSREVPGMAYLLQEVEDWIKTCLLKPDDVFDYSHVFEYRQLSRGLVAVGRADEALPLLDRLIEASHTGDRRGDAIEFLTIQAMAQFSLGNTASALTALGQAFTMAEPEGYIRVFADEGQPMMSLLKEAKARGVTPRYVDQLLAAFPLGMEGSRTSQRSATTSSSQIVEPLSEREVEVLRLLAAGLKYDEIGDQLFISLNTVRTHIKNIYSKFNVSSRTEALIHARDLYLV